MGNLEQTLAYELSRMVMRNLDYSPAADDIGVTIDIYLEDLMNAGLRDEDSERLQIAMKKIAGCAERFPRVKDILDALPRKTKAPALELKISEEQKEKNLKRIQDITRKMANGHKV